MKTRIVLLAGHGDSSNIVYHHLAKVFDVIAVIQETKASNKTEVFKRRWKKLGPVKVLGQTAFSLLVPKFLQAFSGARIRQIYSDFSLNKSPIPEEKIKWVSHFNSDETIQLIKDLEPDVTVLNGTRIISQRVLSEAGCAFINTHVGITPKYRGVHGAYWALVNRDKENCGVTVHYVDKGIDTGAVIQQTTVEITDEDNFVTYPLLQLAAGLGLLEEAIRSHITGKVVTKPAGGESKLYYHPTLFEYLGNRILKKVK